MAEPVLSGRPENPCPVCAGRDLRRVFRLRDHLVSGEWFTLRECRTCRTRLTYPVPEEGRLRRYYESEDYISHTAQARGLINRLYYAARWFLLRGKRAWIQRVSHLKTGTLLDIGCGSGGFLAALERAGWTVQGIEPSPRARRQARTRRGLEVFPPERLSTLPAGGMDVITLWHALEHVPDPAGMLVTIHRLLKAGGTLVLAVPNYNSLDADIYRDHWAAYDVPRHRVHFTAPALQGLLARCGFRVRELGIMPLDSLYIALLSEKFLGSGGNYLRGISIGFRSLLQALPRPGRGSSILLVAGKRVARSPDRNLTGH